MSTVLALLLGFLTFSAQAGRLNELGQWMGFGGDENQGTPHRNMKRKNVPRHAVPEIVEDGSVSFDAPNGTVWKPTGDTLKCGGSSPCRGDVTFTLYDIAAYHETPWAYPLDGSLKKHSREKYPGATKRYSITKLIQYVKEHPDDFVEPTGFIHHQTRCGSTLVANMLAHVPSNMVASEANVPRSVLKLLRVGKKPTQHQIEAIKVVYKLMAPVQGGHTHSFFKYTSAAGLKNVLSVFPDTPWIYLFREPTEVIISNLNGAFNKANSPKRKENKGDGKTFIAPCLGHKTGHPERDCMHYLSRMNQIGLSNYELYPKSGLLVEYRNLPEVMWEYIYPEHFGLKTQMASDEGLLKSGSGVYSKAFANKRIAHQDYHAGDDKKRQRSVFECKSREGGAGVR